MAYKIDEKCTGCGACLPECPVNAISEGEPYMIDAEKCTDCGACVGTCPVGAISQKED
ncbi:MAG: 4Fe-4S binding protein [Candidatus Omnitrophica bacterium]|nr:4Fe-4S binding protein [Candidatus Omnitrophota bacterium]